MGNETHKLQFKGSTGLLLTLGALIALGPFSIDMYLPAFPAIAGSLHTDIAHVGYSLSSYYAGLCAGQLVYGVLIDRFGRKKPLRVGLFIYILATAVCAMALNVQMLIVARLMMALGGCVGLVVARAVVTDLFSPQARAGVLSKLVLVMGVSPVIAPSIGSFVNLTLGWRWVFLVMALIAVLILCMIQRFLPESKPADESVPLKFSGIVREYLVVLKTPGFLVCALAGSISYAGLYAYIAGSPFVFMAHYSISESNFAWVFALNAAGLILGSQLNGLLLKRYTVEKLTRSAMVLLLLSALILVLAAICRAGSVMMIAGIFLFLFFLGIINPNTTAMAFRPFSTAAGRASAMLGSIQMISGVLSSWLVSFYGGSLAVMPLVMLGCAAVATIILFYKSVNSKYQ